MLDLTRLLPGGFCTLILNDLGAEIIKVEDPNLGDYVRYFGPYVDGIGIYHLILNRGKKSVALDLKKEGDREKFYDLVKKSDVVIEGFRAGVVEKLGVDFNTVKRYNHRIVYCSVRGFIEKAKDRPIHDLNAVGLSGILELIKLQNREIKKIPIPIADLAAGSMCAIGVLSGLLKSRLSGEPVKIDVGLVESSFFWNIVNLATLIGNGKVEEFFTIKKKSYYDVFKTKDGKYVTVATIEDKFWSKFVKKLGLEIEDRETYEAYSLVRNRIGEFTLEELLNMFSDDPICLEPVYSIKDVLESKMFKHLLPKFKHSNKPIILTPLKINGQIKGKIDKPPKLGENQNILENL